MYLCGERGDAGCRGLLVLMALAGRCWGAAQGCLCSVTGSECPGNTPQWDEVTQECQEQLRAVPAVAAVSSPRPCCRHPGGCSPTGTSPSRSAPRRKAMSSFGGRRGEEGVRQGEAAERRGRAPTGSHALSFSSGSSLAAVGPCRPKCKVCLGQVTEEGSPWEAGCYNGTRTPGTAPHHASCTGAADVVPQ